MDKLKILVETINKHDVSDNQFYKKWLNSRLNIDNLAIFIRNYWEWTFRFPGTLAQLIANMENTTARFNYTKILFSEMGSGVLKRIHFVLFEEFAEKLSEKLGYSGYLKINNLQKKIPLLKQTIELNTWQRETYSKYPAMATGAQLALEWQAYTMIRKLYEGARNYMELWDNSDEFHETCEFFYVHIGEAEKEHKEESILAAAELIDSGMRFEDIEKGFHKNLELICNFWNAIAGSFANE